MVRLLRIKDLIKNLDVLEVKGSLDKKISGINFDSRKIKPGNLFLAIKGHTVDGHNFLDDVVAKGASAVVVERDVATKDGVTIIKVENTRLALAKLSSKFLGEPSKMLELVGITGTNGKTTISYLLKSILEEAGMKIGLIGTNGNIIDGKLYKSEHTTPESLIIQENLAYMLKCNTDICIMEVSSHSLDMERVESIDFDVGIFTNLSEEHLDFHKTMENYFDCKLKLFSMTKRANIINYDDYYGKIITEKITKHKATVITYGITDKADIYASNINHKPTGASFRINTPKDSIDIHLNIPGNFSVYNALAAASCGYIYSIDLPTIKAGLEKLDRVKGRFEIIPIDRDFTVIIDFAHTADSLKEALITIDQFAEGKKIVVFGAGGDRDKAKRPKMGEVAAKYADLSIVTSDNPRNEEPEEIIKDIIKGIEKVNGSYVSYINREDAIRYAIKNAKSRDVILLAGKGHENYTIIGDKVIPFDERQIVFDVLKEMD